MLTQYTSCGGFIYYADHVLGSIMGYANHPMELEPDEFGRRVNADLNANGLGCECKK